MREIYEHKRTTALKIGDLMEDWMLICDIKPHSDFNDAMHICLAYPKKTGTLQKKIWLTYLNDKVHFTYHLESMLKQEDFQRHFEQDGYPQARQRLVDAQFL